MVGQVIYELRMTIFLIANKMIYRFIDVFHVFKVLIINKLSIENLKLFIFFLCISTQIFSQESLEFKHLQEKDGLSYNIVNCFLKDRNGFLWVGTYNGLNRFDGSHFTVFKNDRKKANSLINNTVHDLCEDKEGKIWFATNLGIGCYNPKNAQFESYNKIGNKPIGKADCLNILCDRADNIWFNNEKGVFKFLKKTKTFEFYGHDSTNKQSILKGLIVRNGMVEDPNKNGLWIATLSGLCYLDTDSKQFFHYQNNPENLPVFKHETTTAISIYKKNKLIFSNNPKGVLIYDLGSHKILKEITLQTNKITERHNISSIVTDNQSNIWVSSTAYCLFFIDGKSYQQHTFAHDETEKSSIAGSFFWDGIQNNDGTLLFGTINGITYTNPSQAFYRLHRIEKKIPSLANTNGIYSFCEDDDGSWWLGTEKNGLLHYYPNKDSLLEYPFKGVIFSIKKVKNQIFIGGETGFSIFNISDKKYTDISLPNKSKVPILSVQVQKDSLIWLASFDKFAYRYHLKSQKIDVFELENPPEVWRARTVYHLLIIDKKEDIWLSYYWGALAKFSEKDHRFNIIKSKKKNYFEENYYKNSVDSQNNFWIAAKKNGLLKYSPNTNSYQIWSEGDGLVFNHLIATEVDKLGQIWAVAYNKFSVFNTHKNTFKNFTLPINESYYNYINSLFLQRNGNVLAIMGGILAEFFPEKIHNYSLKNAPLISSLVLPDSIILLPDSQVKVNLGVNQNDFNINFGTMNFAQSNENNFVYQLAGFNEKWIDAGIKTFVNYTNIPGGDYVFRVKSVAGNSETKITELHIHIDTVIYKTRWFLALIALLLIGLVYAVYKYRTSQLNRFHTLQLFTSALEKDKTEIQYQNLINHLNPHFLFNSLTSLNSLIIKNPRNASDFLEKLSLIYRYILQNKDKGLVDLKTELSFVNHYIDLQKSRFKAGLQVNIDVPKKFLIKNIVPVTTQNLIENAIKHNIMDIDSPLIINIYVKDGFLFVVNNLQKKQFVETSNKQGLNSLKDVYKYMTKIPLETIETVNEFIVKVPLL